MFELQKTKIEDLYIVKPKFYGDQRGYFVETYNEKDFHTLGLTYRFVQDNQSKSKKGVLRGLHFQKKHPQAKLVRVIQGKVFDVAVDLRKKSQTYGQWVGITLSEDNPEMFMIPKGFAHGFVVLSESAIFSYKCDDFYHPEDEGGLLWNDPDINITWPNDGAVILSEKDKKNGLLKDSKFFF